MPSYIWMTSISPTLNLATSWAAFCANAGVRNSSGPSSPKAAPAAAAEITKPRREMLCMKCHSLGSLNLVKGHPYD